MIGLTGAGLATPFLRETVFITSGYKKIDIWFAPIPLADYGHAAQRFRALELTRTKFTSVIKAELLMLPIIFICSFLFWWFFWQLHQIPSSAFPYAARVWPVAARQAYLIFTANSSDSPLLLQAINPAIIGGASAFGLLIYGGLMLIGQPVQFFYGLLGGLGAPTHVGINMMLGAVASRYYFRRKFGERRWKHYVPVVVAFFSSALAYQGILSRLMSSDDVHVQAVLERAGVFVNDAEAMIRQRDQRIWLMSLSVILCLVGITNTILMSVTERFREIGTLKCLGALDIFVVRLFLVENVFVGVLASLLGGLVGCGLAVLQFGAVFEFSLMSWSVAAPELLAGMLKAIVLGTVLTFLASVYPTYVASRMRPVDAMRVEV